MIGEELLQRMKAKEIGVILESREDAAQLAALLHGVENADELVEWYDERHARVIVHNNYGDERLMFSDSLSAQNLHEYCRECVPLSAIMLQDQINISSLDDFV